MTTVPIRPPMTPEMKAKRKAEFAAARNVYIAIIVAFVSVCTVAVILTSNMEAHKQGFQAIHTDAPMSFVDKTYYKPHPAPARN